MRVLIPFDIMGDSLKLPIMQNIVPRDTIFGQVDSEQETHVLFHIAPITSPKLPDPWSEPRVSTRNVFTRLP